MNRFELKQVVKRFGAVTAVNGVDLAVAEGEFVVFVGPSGCGKSTLLRLIAGLEEIADGEMQIDGRRMNETPPAKRGIAMVFQSYALYPHMNVERNLGFALETSGLPRTEIAARVGKAAGFLKIEHLLDRRPAQLSGGQQQRVAIGRALVREQKLFLFDEPLSNLDADLRMEMRVEIARIHRELGATTIYVTHDQLEAMTLADRIVVLKDGKIVQTGAPMELYERPANRFVAGFIGAPRMNFLPASIEAAEAGSRLTILDQSHELPSLDYRGDATLGVRPEHLKLGGGEISLTGHAQAVEPLGGEALIHVRLANQQLIVVKSQGRPTVKAEDPVTVGWDSADAYLFDDAGDAIPMGAAS